MKNLHISVKVLAKLEQKHGVSRREVEQCFENREGPLLIDDREEHRSDPPTHWFIAPTNRGRLLKVVFVPSEGKIHLRTCYEPNETEIRIYSKHSRARWTP
ncbi:MAG: ADP-ribosyl-(dinitrogen reductase) hydrolase [Burkholderiales bacterium]|nr:ADP-ribosyl-(dinitrogen reductase) hydrolase [Burkholderiales bacterium]